MFFAVLEDMCNKVGLITCDDGSCVKPEWICDGIPHCSKKEDEKDCIKDLKRGFI